MAITINPDDFNEERMLIDPQEYVATDASTKGQKVGCGIAIVNNRDIRIISYGTNERDNNIGEAKAIDKVLTEFDKGIDRHLLFYTDSLEFIKRLTYIRDTKGKYNKAEEMRSRNSQQLTGLVKKIYHKILQRKERVTFVHVRSHRGHYLNELADRAAKDALNLSDGYCVVEYIENTEVC